MPLLCTRIKAKVSLLMLQGFTWEFSKCWLQMTCNPRMAESRMQEFRGAHANSLLQQHTQTSAASVPKCYKRLKEKPGDESSFEEVLIQKRAPLSPEGETPETPQTSGTTLPEGMVPKQHAALPPSLGSLSAGEARTEGLRFVLSVSSKWPAWRQLRADLQNFFLSRYQNIFKATCLKIVLFCFNYQNTPILKLR